MVTTSSIMLAKPEDLLVEDTDAHSLMQFVSTDMTSQDVFRVARTGNPDNLSFKTGEACETDSYSSVLNKSAVIGIVEDSLPINSGEYTQDWMNTNMNFETEDFLSQPLEFTEYLDLSNDHPSVFNTQCLHAGFLLDADPKPSSAFSENSNVIDLEYSPEQHRSPSNQTESAEGEIPSIEGSPFSNDSRSNSVSKKMGTTPAEKYLEMRRKNNIASQQSRKKRKLKDFEMTEKLEKLEAENKKLLMLAENLEKKRDALQKYLLDVVAQK